MNFPTKNANVVVQGITGNQGQFHTKSMLDYGTSIVAGVTPGKAGQEVHRVTVYNSVSDAKEVHGDISTTVIFVPARFAKGAVLEAIEAGLSTVVAITEGIPVQDTMTMIQAAQKTDCRIIGPNGPGMMYPEALKLGIMPSDLCKQGSIGVVSKSGTLSYEIAKSLDIAGLGVTAYIGIGGDPVRGTSFIEVLDYFETDSDTEKIVLVGEIGGDEEELASAHIKEFISKPVVAYIAGKSAPEGKRMGHAGAIISGESGRAIGKIEALQKVGAIVTETPWEIAEQLEMV